MKEDVLLTKLDEGESGHIVKILGGHNTEQKLSALGIRTGKKIKKITSMFLKGPVTISVGSTKIALGHGMANKITVEVLRK